MKNSPRKILFLKVLGKFSILQENEKFSKKDFVNQKSRKTIHKINCVIKTNNKNLI